MMERSNRYRPPIRRGTEASPTPEPVIGRCPYLGVDKDPTTALSFPAEANHCHCKRIPAPISLIHQEVYCLTSDFTNCPVYRQNEGQSKVAIGVAVAAAAQTLLKTPPVAPTKPQFAEDEDLPEMIPLLAAAATIPGYEAPAEAYDQPYIAPSSRLTPGRVMLLGLLAVGLVAAGLWAWQQFRGTAADSTLAGGTQGLPTLAAQATLPTTEAGAAGLLALPTVESIWATASPLPTPRPLQTPTPLAMPTDTSPQIMAVLGSPTPTTADDALPTAEAYIVETATATSEPTTEPATLVPTPIGPRVCVVPAGWVPYVIQIGDTLSALSVRHNIALNQIVAANCLNDLNAYLGATIYLPPIAGMFPVVPPAGGVVPVATPAGQLPPAMGQDPTAQPLPTSGAQQPTSVPPTQVPPPATSTAEPVRPTATPPSIESPTAPPPPPTATPRPPLPPTSTPPSIEP